MHPRNDTQPKRRPVNLTIREDIVASAKELGLNTSKAAEAGIMEAVRKAREEAWLSENKNAIAAHNERIDRDGLMIEPYWLENQ